VLPGSAYWNPAIRMIWQILLPIIFVVSTAVPFVSYRKGELSIYEVIVLTVALLLLAILVPISLNALYGA
jgi:hypothetical protein